MTFTSYTHQVVKEKLSITIQLYLGGLCVWGLGLVILLIDQYIAPTGVLTWVITALFVIGGLLILIAYFYQFFDYERIEITNKGSIELTDTELILDHKKRIQYSDIIQFSVACVAYYNQNINLGYRTPNERHSLGLTNTLKMATAQDTIELHFKLENKAHQQKLEKCILTLVIDGKFEQLGGKTTIKLIPKQFKNTDAYKDYVIKQIVEKRINCTEGLLLHGYSSDREATLLREKYCG
ncbi:hypothetical protein [uncultured Marixanthomonas sp.]|mgnify:CR=1 FL=1|uniref:hypothetical protein n=1 Tax=uncultured Marixanthomonas sp. TaxID=757245 RepID=UPI0030DBCEA9